MATQVRQLASETFGLENYKNLKIKLFKILQFKNCRIFCFNNKLPHNCNLQAINYEQRQVRSI